MRPPHLNRSKHAGTGIIETPNAFMNPPWLAEDVSATDVLTVEILGVAMHGQWRYIVGGAPAK